MTKGTVVTLMVAGAAAVSGPVSAQDPAPIPHALWLGVVDSVAAPGPVVAVPQPLCIAYATGCGAEVPVPSRFGGWGGDTPERVHALAATGEALRARLGALGCGTGAACTVAGLGPVREPSRGEVVLTLELERIAARPDRLMDVTGYAVTLRWAEGAWRVAAVRVTRRS